MAFDSLFIGVTGLEAYQQQIDTISNNIANIGSTGYKGQNVSFQDLLYQTQKGSSAPSQTNGGTNAIQSGDGVKVASIDSNFQQGGLETTGINTDLALDGDGFFILADKNGANQTYTRDGHFQLNQDGLLYDPTTGLGVQGYQATKSGAIVTTAPPTSIQIPLGLSEKATATGAGAKLGPTNDQVYDISFGGNLDQTQYIAAVSNAAVATYVAPITTITTTLYDSLGNGHLVNVAFQPAVGGPPANAANPVGATLPIAVKNAQGVPVTAATEWAYTISPTDGSVFGTTVPTGYAFFDQNGQFINTSSDNTAATTVHQQLGNPSALDGNQVSVTQWSSPTGANNSTTDPSTVAGGPIGVDLSNLTSLAGAATPNTVAQNGYKAGILSNINIGNDGTVTGSFTNGQTQTLAQVVVAAFQNEQGLVRVGSSQFKASANSGVAQYGFATTGRYGTIQSGNLEQSNVSIADEFTKMILAQRSFEANSRSITTADQDLQTVIALKR